MTATATSMVKAIWQSYFPSTAAEGILTLLAVNSHNTCRYACVFAGCQLSQNAVTMYSHW